MTEDELDALPADDQVTVLIGRLTRDSVGLEMSVRAVLAAFDGASAPLPPRPERFSDLLAQCQKRLGTKSEAEYVAVGQSILDEAGAMYRRRNRYVHDLFVRQSADVEIHEQYRISGNSARASSVPALVVPQDIKQVVLENLHLRWRLRALRQVILDEKMLRTHWRFVLNGLGRANWRGDIHFTPET